MSRDRARVRDGIVGGRRGLDTEVGQLRRRLEASRAGLGILLGVADSTVERWEEGREPERVQRVLVDVLKDVANEHGESIATGVVQAAKVDLRGALRQLFALEPRDDADGPEVSR